MNSFLLNVRLIVSSSTPVVPLDQNLNNRVLLQKWHLIQIWPPFYTKFKMLHLLSSLSPYQNSNNRVLLSRWHLTQIQPPIYTTVTSYEDQNVCLVSLQWASGRYSLVVSRWASKALELWAVTVSWGSLTAVTRGGGGLELAERHEPLRDRLNIFSWNKHEGHSISSVFSMSQSISRVTARSY